MFHIEPHILADVLSILQSVVAVVNKLRSHRQEMSPRSCAVVVLCLVDERTLPAAADSNRRGSRSVPLGPVSSSCASLIPVFTSTAGNGITATETVVAASKASVLTTTEAVVDLLDRLLATNLGVTHLFAVGALHAGPILRSGAVSRPVVKI
jgi:acetyl-CoA acetyltransferase